MRNSLFILFLLILIACARREKDIFPIAPDLTLMAPQMINPGEVGNGGHGIKVGDKIYLYDLWEAGLEKGPKHPFTAKDIGEQLTYAGDEFIRYSRFTSIKHTAEFFRDQLRAKFSEDQDLVESVADRLAVLYELDATMALVLFETIQAYTWVDSESAPRDLKLPEPVHKTAAGDVVLLANRSGRYIYLFTQFTKLMDGWNRAGLVFHEAVYALLPPQKILLPNGNYTLKQNGKRARQIVGVLSGSMSIQNLFETGFASYIGLSELPQNRFSRRNSPFKVTSTFFTRLNIYPPHYLKPDRLAIVGVAHYQLSTVDPRTDNKVVVKIDPLAIDGPGGDAYREIPKKLAPFCEVMAVKRGIPYQIELVFSPEGQDKGEQGYELRFENYQEGEEIKEYVAHSVLKEEVVQVGGWGESDTFWAFAEDLAPNPGGGPRRLVKPVTETALTYLTGTIRHQNFFYVSKFPLDPIDRYGF